MPSDMKEKKKEEKKEAEENLMKFYCQKCEIHFDFEDGTPLDDIKCPKCGTYEIFIEYEEEDGEVIL